jgi:hypothetical protein
MGLDMYMIGLEKDSSNELAYWRKHPDLHGFIVNIFANGVDNCQEIQLSLNELKHILRSVEEDNLPTTSGFFFGTSQPDYKISTIQKLNKVIEWVSSSIDRRVIYQPSW